MTNKVLVVDDNFYNRDLARLALENVGFSVTEAENGVQALQHLKREKYALLILDLAMPELDGHGVMAELRKTSEHSKMKIIVLTAHAHMAEGLELQADFVMHKPIDINMFALLLERLKARQDSIN